MNRDELLNRLNGEEETEVNSGDDELFNDINNVDTSDDDSVEDDLFNDINNEDNDNTDDIGDDFSDESDEEDSVDASSIGLGKLKKIQLSSKSLLLGFGAIALVILLIVGIISFIVIHNNKPPVAQIVHIESNNPTNKSTAKYGNMITLSFTFDKQIKNTPTVIINGKNVEVTGSGREFKANYFVIEQDYEEILVEFSIEDYKDSFGKTGNKINNTTDLSKVTILAIGA